MAKSNFVHLHVHSENSLLDGLESPSNLIEKAKELNMDSLALTDHGTMRGLLNFYYTAKKNDINPILGQEFYFHPDRTSKNQKDTTPNRDFDDTKARSYHTTILIKNEIGWKNCINLTTEANTSGFYYHPRIDMELISNHKDGLIMGSGCMGSIVNQNILHLQYDQAKYRLDEFIKIFGDDFFIELTTTEDHNQKKLNSWLIKYAKDNGILFTIGSDVHFIDKESYYDHDVLYCVQFGKKYSAPIWEGPNMPKGFRRKSPVRETWLKSEDEMWDYWREHCQPIRNQTEDEEFSFLYIEEKDFQQAMDNTAIIADRCKNIDLEKTYSDYRMPDMNIGSPQKELFSRCLKNNYRDSYLREKKSEEQSEYIKRLNREIELICDQGFASYFMMTADLTDHLKENNIMKGIGRGSAGGSLLAWWLGITDIDPLLHNLSFERFMNAQKKSMPDIDIDIDDEKRPEILKYFINKYGEDNVAQIGTYVAMQEKASLKDVARALNMPFDKINMVTKSIDGYQYDSLFDEEQFNQMISDRKIGDTLKELVENQPDWIKLSKRFEGNPKAVGRHPAGIVVGDESLRNLVPLQKAKDVFVTEWIDGTYRKELTEDLKLVKFDLLGLSNLGIIQNIISLIREKEKVLGSDPNCKLDLSLPDSEVLSSIPIDDEKVFELFPNELLGIFQFETSAVQKVLKHMTPRNLKELCALNSLNRPATKELVEEYVSGRDNGNIKYDHEIIKEVLDETYGVMLYQEQVMELSNKLGKIPLDETDNFRKALVKFTDSNKETQEEIRETILNKFIQGAMENGLEEDKAKDWAEKMAKFAGYGFNKSHSRAYSLLSYYTLYLKTYFKDEFYTAYLNKRPDRLNEFFGEIMHYKFLPVDINKSQKDFTLEGSKIRIGFKAVKGLGDSAIDELISKRETYSKYNKHNGNYVSIEDVTDRCNKAKVNKTRIKALSNVGAFYDFGVESSFEKELQLLGFSVRFNKTEVVREFKERVRSNNTMPEVFNFVDIIDLPNLPSRGSRSLCSIIGCVNNIKVKTWRKTVKDKQGKDVSKVNIGFEGEISDETGNCHFVRWYGDYKNSFKRGSIIMMIGKKNEFGGKIQINLPSQSEIIGDPKYPSQWEKIGVSTPFKLLAI